MSREGTLFQRHSTKMFFGVVLGITIAGTICGLLDAANDFAAPYLGQRYPEWSWRHGTVRMQGVASRILINRVKPGMTFQEVLDILGPGSLDWPAVKNRPPISDPDPNVEDAVSFNLRTWGNDGIDVYFKRGRVTHAQFYD